MAASAIIALTRRRWRWLVGIGVIIAGLWLLRIVTLPQEPLLPTGTLRVGIDPSNPPFAFDTGGAYVGLEVELAQELATHMSAPIQFVGLGFDGLYDALKVEQADIIIAALVPDPLRTGDVHYSPPYFDNGLVLVSPQANALIEMREMSGRALAYAFGSQADAEVQRWLRRIAVFETRPYETPTIALDAVRLSEADAALVQAVDARQYLREYPVWQATLTPVTHAPFVIAVPIDRGRLAAEIGAALRALQVDGTLDALIAEWL